MQELKSKAKRRQSKEVATVQNLDKGFYMRCTESFLEAMAAAVEQTGMTKAQLVDAALAKMLPEHFAQTGRAAQPSRGVQNAHTGPFCQPERPAKQSGGVGKRRR